MLKYKQIWHGIKPIKWLIKFNLMARLQATNENKRDGNRTNLKELPRPHKLLQGAPAKSVVARVKIGKTCLPPIGPPCIYKVFKKSQPP